MTNMGLPVFILIRTSNRPNFFKSAIESVKKQTYKNIFTIVHYDTPDDLHYIEADKIVYSPRQEPNGVNTAPYNLYCNKLMSLLPNSHAWYYFLDDDDVLADCDVIEKLVFYADEYKINVGRVDRGAGLIFPDRWGVQQSFSTECFFLNCKYKNLATWPAKKAGDHHYSKQLTRLLQVNWIDNLLIAKAQLGKGAGKRIDK